MTILVFRSPLPLRRLLRLLIQFFQPVANAQAFATPLPQAETLDGLQKGSLAGRQTVENAISDRYLKANP